MSLLEVVSVTGMERKKLWTLGNFFVSSSKLSKKNEDGNVNRLNYIPSVLSVHFCFSYNTLFIIAKHPYNEKNGMVILMYR